MIIPQIIPGVDAIDVHAGLEAGLFGVTGFEGNGAIHSPEHALHIDPEIFDVEHNGRLVAIGLILGQQEQGSIDI